MDLPEGQTAFFLYLTQIEDIHIRSALTKLRLSAHNLNIESLRGQIKDPEQRKCNMCNLDTVENEVHFIAQCPKYDHLRTHLLNSMAHLPNITQLSHENLTIWLLTNEDKFICKAVGKFIYECFKARSQSIKQ